MTEVIVRSPKVFDCLSTDEKPALPNGNICYETDTGHYFDRKDGVWVLRPLVYIDKADSWAAVGTGAWEEKDLSGYGVPAGVVCEIMIINASQNDEYEGGVRATGSSLSRLVDLHEAEGGGLSVVTMHVMSDSNSKIEQYAENSNISFALIGYWG